MPEFVHFLWISALGISLFALAEWMYHVKKIHVEITRKIVHMGSGLLVLLFPIYFQNQWYVLLICGLFQLILVLSNTYGYLKSINAVKRKTYGSLIFHMVVYLVYLAWYYSGSRLHETVHSYVYFYLPILIMAFCNPLATLVGRFYPILKFKTLNKSIGGVLAFWALAFLLSCFTLLYSHLFNAKDITWVAIFIATVASVTELYSKKGLGNLFIPIAVLIVMYLTEFF